MTPSRAARLALLAVFLVGTFSGPLLALCLPGAEPATCCCTKNRQCQRPQTAEAWARGCCKTNPPAAPATSSERFAAEAAFEAIALVVSTTAGSDVAITSNPSDATALRVDGVGLYTVHEAFLI